MGHLVRVVLAAVLAVPAALGGAADQAVPVSATPSSTAQAPASPATDAAPHPSDEDIDVVAMLKGFTAIERDHPSTLQENIDITSRINRTASPDRQVRAIEDAVGDMSLTMADGLGLELGADYTRARERGELPLTAALVARGEEAVSAPWTSSHATKTHFRYTRPFIRFPDRITRVDDPTGKVYAVAPYSFPSGHSTQAWEIGLTLATMLPELAPQILARASEAADNRVVLGVHYALDVVAGRMMATRMIAARWHDPTFRPLLEAARHELRSVLSRACGADLPTCVARDVPYLSTAQAVEVVTERLSYGFTRTGPAGVALQAPEGAEDLLLTTFPDLTATQRRQVLVLTAQGSGYPLDLSGTPGTDPADVGWQRLDLAAAMAAHPHVLPDGSVTLPADEVSPAARLPGVEAPEDGAGDTGWPSGSAAVAMGAAAACLVVALVVAPLRRRRGSADRVRGR